MPRDEFTCAIALLTGTVFLTLFASFCVIYGPKELGSILLVAVFIWSVLTVIRKYHARSTENDTTEMLNARRKEGVPHE